MGRDKIVKKKTIMDSFAQRSEEGEIPNLASCGMNVFSHFFLLFA